MSGSEKDLFGGPNQHACKECYSIHATGEAAQKCADKDVREARRNRARAFARTGESQFKKAPKP